MAYDKKYLDQVELLLDVLPLVNDLDCFAIKGGTAINLFIRDLPRLSVDIDLTYILPDGRADFLHNLASSLDELESGIKFKLSTDVDVKKLYTKSKQLLKLVVARDGVAIKIEPNLVLRGNLFDTEARELCPLAQSKFIKYSTIKMLSLEEVYAGKICAALDRQHPRDLFDIKFLFENEGLSKGIVDALTIYLASSPRPMRELIKPNELNIREEYLTNFKGMTEREVSLNELLDIREKLFRDVRTCFTDDQRGFLLSVKKGSPNWELVKTPRARQFPAPLIHHL